MAEPKIAPPGSFFHKRHQKFSMGRLRIEVLTFEEAGWLIIGLLFGWMAGKGMKLIVLMIPAVLFIVWVYEKWYASKHGLRFIHNAPAKRR